MAISKKDRQWLVSTKMWRSWNPYALLDGMWTGAATVEDSIKIPQNFQYRVTTWLSNHTAWYIPNKKENMFIEILTNVCTSTIHNSQIDKLNVIYPSNGIPFCNKNEIFNYITI